MNTSNTKTIALNRKARHDYFIEQTFEAGLMLQGWEVKSLRDGHVQLKESYITLKAGAPYLVGAHISPLKTASTHIQPDPTRTRKLLLHAKEIKSLIGAIEQEGYTIVPLSLYWQRGKAKLEIALVKGKKQYDKRQTIKTREWEREKSRTLKRYNR